MNAIKRFLLARFIPHRTMVGLGLLLVSTIGETLLSSDFCSGVDGPAAVCGVTAKVVSVVAPWLTVMGVADQKRA